MSGQLNYVVGDATNPIGNGNKLIIHCCNDIGGWGSGFVVALSNKWGAPEMHYRAWSKGHCDDFKLGEVQFVTVEYDIVVANMIGQSGIGWSAGRPPIRYGALAGCMERAAIYAKKNGMSIHAPRFGAVLAGGNWTDIEWLINKIILPYDVDVTIYDLPVAEDNSNLIKQRQDMNLF